MDAISARDITTKMNPIKVQIYPQKRIGRPPLIRPPTGALAAGQVLIEALPSMSWPLT